MVKEPKDDETKEEPEVMPEEEGIVEDISAENGNAHTSEETVSDAGDEAKTAEKPPGKNERTTEKAKPDTRKPSVTKRTRAKKAKPADETTGAAPPRTVMTPVGTDDDIDQERFAEMAELYEESFRELEEDSIVKGKVVTVTKEDVLVDIGYKSEGSIPLSEFPDADELKVGRELEVYLEKKEDQDGLIVLSKEKADFFRAWDRVREVYEENGEIEGTIVERVRGGFIVDIGVRAFLPSSQLDIRPVSDFDEYIGKKHSFKVIKVNRRRRNIVLSRKALLDEARAEKKSELLGILKKGLILEGEVKNITDFGAFVDLGGLDGLLHITDISWGRVRHPSDLLSIGDRIEVMVLDFDLEKERVSLGLKQLKAHPWEDIKERYKEGDKIVGTVVSIVDYGAFVEMEEGIEGLIHISEMSWTHRVKHPSKILSVGDEVETVILNIDEENQRISLGLRQTMENPWEDIAKRFAAGTVFEGVVRNITDFGAFVELEEGIDGLIRVSDMSWTKRIRHPSDVLTKGETVRVVVLNVDPVNQRISLGIKQLEPNPWDAIEQSYPVGTYIDGEIVRITNYGAIVRFEDELEGLLHISEIAGERVSNVNEYLNVGDRVRVKVINVSAKDHRINLSLWQYQQETGEDGIIQKAEPAALEREPRESKAADVEDVPETEPEESETKDTAEETEAAAVEEEKSTDEGVEATPPEEEEPTDDEPVKKAETAEEQPTEDETVEETSSEESETGEGEPLEKTETEEEKPAEDKTAEEPPAEEEKTTEDETVKEAEPEEEKPAEDKTAEEPPAEEEKTTEDETVEETPPAEEKPSEDEPVEETPPVEEKPSEDEPVEETPLEEEKPSEDGAVEETPPEEEQKSEENKEKTASEENVDEETAEDEEDK